MEATRGEGDVAEADEGCLQGGLDGTEDGVIIDVYDLGVLTLIQ